MADFEYLASVIVPVYNVEKYLQGCLESLLNQTVDFSKLQVLLINDGSKDSSEEICKSYAEKYDNIFLFTKENEGLSGTRNFGLSKATGKYIFYLDSDDTLKPETIQSVCDFFDSVYDETDLVTYKIIQYYQERPTVVHYRYMTLTKSGVYDLRDPANRFITQTNINICVKNKFDKNIYFDTTPSFRHEDEKYCCEVLREKMKIGYCEKGEYVYNRNNIDSIVSTQFSPEKIFETSMQFYEALFDSFPGKVPAYYQGIVFNDFRWKLNDKKFLPLHLEGDEWIKANRRIDCMLRRMDADTILLHPSLSVENMHYWLKRRGCCTVVNDENGLLICCDGKLVYNERKLMLSKTAGDDGVVLKIKSPVFFHLKKSNVKILLNSKEIDFSFADNHTDKTSCEAHSFYPEFTIKSDGLDSSELSVMINSVEYKLN